MFLLAFVTSSPFADGTVHESINIFVETQVERCKECPNSLVLRKAVLVLFMQCKARRITFFSPVQSRRFPKSDYTWGRSTRTGEDEAFSFLLYSSRDCKSKCWTGSSRDHRPWFKFRTATANGCWKGISLLRCRKCAGEQYIHRNKLLHLL